MKKLFWIILLTVALLSLAAACGSTKTVTTTVSKPMTLKPQSENLDKGASGCGAERASIKHLINANMLLSTTPTVMTPTQLVNLSAPPVTQDSPQFTNWNQNGEVPEGTLVELKDVHIIAVKQESDSDLHTIISTATGAELNIELPAASCDSSSPYASYLAQARAAADQAMLNATSSGYTPVDIYATVEGPIFYDVLHGQRGAPNGVELHPILYFSTDVNAQPPTITASGGQTTTSNAASTAATTATSTTTSTVPSWAGTGKGCRKYPGRFYYHHKAHKNCKKYYFKTP